jgi:uncharacterized protein YjbI with pentapeptide repeats
VKILSIALVVFVTILALLAIWKVPQWQVAKWAAKGVSSPKELAELEDKFRGTLAQILGGAGLIIGLFFTWKNLVVTQETAANNMRVAYETLKTSQEQQITERFTRAVDQLGNEKIEVRLGGIFALERIARDSDKDYATVVEVLTAFIRENAPWRDKGEHALPEEPRTDVQAALTVLGRRPRTYGHGKELPLYLADTNLRGAHLEHAHFEGAVLWSAHLEGTVLWSADLSGARLTVAHFESANLTEATLEKALLSNTYLEGADLSGASLKGAYVVGSSLKSAILSGAHLENADLTNADLRDASLSALSEHYLLHKPFGAASLSGAALNNANLSGAHLEGVDLSSVHGLTLAQVKTAHTDGSTKLPSDLVQEVSPRRPLPK